MFLLLTFTASGRYTEWNPLDVIQSGTLLCGVTALNSAPIPSSTRNRNSTRVGEHAMKEEEYKIIVNLIRNDGKFHIPKNVKTSVHRSAYLMLNIVG